MKRFKKIAAVAVIMAVVSAATFAVDYSGDVQLQLGWQGATTTVGNPLASFGVGDDFKFQSNAFYIGVENWNLFNLNDLFSVGFFEKVDLGMRIASSGKVKMGGNEGDLSYSRFAANFLIGPAVGIRAGNIAKFQIGVGFVGGFEFLGLDEAPPLDFDIYNGVIGFGVDLQAKFLPHVIVSPLVGFQYAFRGMGEYTIDADDSTTIEESFNAHSYAIYVGGSVNFGKR